MLHGDFIQRNPIFAYHFVLLSYICVLCNICNMFAPAFKRNSSSQKVFKTSNTMPEEGLSDRLFQALKDLNVGSGSAANRIKTYEYVQNAL